MQQFFLAIILVLGLGCWWLYGENQTLKSNNIKLEQAVKEQEEAIATIKESYEKQGAALNQLNQKNAQIEAEMAGYLDIFRRHNLNMLAEAKPGLIEKRINDGTVAVFKDIENDSKEISNLNK